MVKEEGDNAFNMASSLQVPQSLITGLTGDDAHNNTVVLGLDTIMNRFPEVLIFNLPLTYHIGDELGSRATVFL